jgi:quercetin dioxygenase-like cupin family protein
VRQVIHGQKMTVARIHLAKGCVVPEHSHEHEQISMVMEGTLKFLIEGREVTLGAGDVLHIPSRAPHRVEALEDSLVTDVFSPVRDDWRTGDDTYLRK